MKYQMTVDGVLVADYYNLEKALDHTRVALEDDRFAGVTLDKVEDDGSAFQPTNTGDSLVAPVESAGVDPNAIQPVAQPSLDPNIPEQQFDANGNVVA